MKILIRVLAGLAVALTLACGGGSAGGSGGVAGARAAGPDGRYVGIDTFVTKIRVVDLGSNTPPVDDDCVGDVDIVVDDAAADVIVGNGVCLLQNNANSATWQIRGGFLDATRFEGEIVIDFSRVTHRLDFSGSLNGDTLEATFAGRTPQVGSIVIDWDGRFSGTR
jgi:hypothetical protein